MKKTFLFLLAVSFLSLVSLSSVPAVNAQAGTNTCVNGYDTVTKLPCTSAGVTTPTDFFSTIQKVFNLVFGILVLVASFMLLYAAFEYITAQGDEEKLNKAKNMIIYAVVAMVVGVLAWGLPKVVLGFFQ